MHCHSHGDPHERLYRVRKLSAEPLERSNATVLLRRTFHVNGQQIQMSLTAHFELIMWGKAWYPENQFLDLRGKHVHAPDDQHVVAAANDLRHATHRSRGGRQQPREIASPVTNDRQ